MKKNEKIYKKNEKLILDIIQNVFIIISVYGNLEC